MILAPGDGGAKSWVGLGWIASASFEGPSDSAEPQHFRAGWGDPRDSPRAKHTMTSAAPLRHGSMFVTIRV